MQFIVEFFYILVKYLFVHKNHAENTDEEIEDEAQEKINQITRDIFREMEVDAKGQISKEEFMKYVFYTYLVDFLNLMNSNRFLPKTSQFY